MIEFLQGTLLEKTPDHVVLNVQGVGYGVTVTSKTYDHLPAAGKDVSLTIRTVVREESLTLFGFHTPIERDVFDLLLTARGVGPRSAMAALATFGPEDLAIAIVEKDIKTISRIPGVGKKTAEQLALDLEKKLAPLAQAAVARRGSSSLPLAEATPATDLDGSDLLPAHQEAAAALQALGCPAGISIRAIAKAREVLGDKAPVEELVREGLKHRRSFG
jgi:Holliday junction DNA helicase RuvA